MRKVDKDDFTFGIELEYEHISKNYAAHAVESALGGEIEPYYELDDEDGDDGDDYTVYCGEDGDWSVVYDGSLHDGAEVVSPILRYEQISAVQTVVRELRYHGAEVRDNCGIHVHVNADLFRESPKKIQNLINLLYKNEALITEAIGIPSDRDTYTQEMNGVFADKVASMKPATINAINQAWYRRGRFYAPSGRYDDNRYYGVNLTSMFVRNSIEFRWFSATRHAGKVRAYINLVLALCAYAVNAHHIPASVYRSTYNWNLRGRRFAALLDKLGFRSDPSSYQHLMRRYPSDCIPVEILNAETKAVEHAQ